MQIRGHALALFLTIVFAAGAEQAQAFKIHTHVWLADQLAYEINESGGRVSINGRQYRLDSRIAGAIEKDPGAFVMGTLGADIYPDMFAGQMTTHPGVNPEGAAPGWQTDDWINHVVGAALRSGDESNIAFAAGYMLHAAMDMWAHSHVNLYSGDLFAIIENSETAQRHVALESYLTKFHVNLREMYPNSPQYDRYTAMRAPAEFVRDTLILNPLAAREYARQTSTGTFYYDKMYRYYLAARRSQTTNLTLATLLQEELSRIDPLLNQLPALKAEVDAKQAAFDAQLMRLANTAQSVLQGIGDVLANSGAQGALDSLGLNIQLDAPAIAAADALDTALGQYNAVTDQIGYSVEGFYDPDTVRATLNQAIALTASGAVIDKWPGDVEAAVDAWVRAWEDIGRELMRPHGLPGRAPTRPMQIWSKCWGPVLFPMTIPPELQQLPVVCAQGMSTVDRVQTQFSMMSESLKNLIPGRMQLRRVLDELEADVMEAVQQHATESLDAFGAAMPNEQIAAVSSDLPADPTGLATWLIRMWDSDTSAADLDLAYEHSSSLKPYVTRRVTPALHRELDVCGNPNAKSVAYTDPPMSNFAPVQNAMAMSKLALLSASGLNSLIGHHAKVAANAAGVRSLSINTRPYASRLPMGAAMIGAIRSIDGDHPWQAIAPPLPRSSRNEMDDGDFCRRFGYPAGDSYAGGDCATDNMNATAVGRKTGMILWQPPYRELVFNELFQPIATALCSFVGYDYPYASCYTTDMLFPAYGVATAGAQRMQSRYTATASGISREPLTRSARTMYSERTTRNRTDSGSKETRTTQSSTERTATKTRTDSRQADSRQTDSRQTDTRQTQTKRTTSTSASTTAARQTTTQRTVERNVADRQTATQEKTTQMKGTSSRTSGTTSRVSRDPRLAQTDDRARVIEQAESASRERIPQRDTASRTEQPEIANSDLRTPGPATSSAICEW